MVRPTWAAVVVAMGVAAAVARGATIVVPPVEISGLAHTFVPANPPTTPNAVAWDGVTFPSGPGTFSGPGFTASIGPTDEVVVRFQAPAGQRFVVNVPAASQSRVFAVEARWLTGVGDTGSQFVQGTVTWIGLEGPAPTQTFAQDGMFDNGQALKVNHQFSVTTSFAFEAIEIRFPVVPAIADVSRTYNAVTSIASPSFVASASGPLMADSVVMELEVVPTLYSWDTCSGSWSNAGDWNPSNATGPQAWDSVEFTASPSCTKVVNLTGSPLVARCEIRSTDVVFQNGTLDVAGPGAGLTVGATGSGCSLTLTTGTILTANALQVGRPGGNFAALTLQGSNLTVGSLAVYQRQGGTGAGGLPIRVQSGSQFTTGHPVIGQQDAGIDVQAGGAWWSQGDVSLTGFDGGGQATLIGTNGNVQIEGTLSLDWGKVEVTTPASVFELGALNLGYAGGEGAVLRGDGAGVQIATGVVFAADVNIGPVGRLQLLNGADWTHSVSVVIDGGGQLDVGLGSEATIDENLSLLPGSQVTGPHLCVGGSEADAINVLGELRLHGDVLLNTAWVRVFPSGRVRFKDVSNGLFQPPPLVIDGGTMIAEVATNVTPGTRIGLTSVSVTGRFGVHILPGFPDDRVARIEYAGTGSEAGNPGIVLAIETLSDLLDFDPGETTPVAGAPVHAAAGDLDGDGFVDLAVAVPDANPALPGSVIVLLNDGVSGGVWQGFSAGVQITTGADPRAVAIGNFDNSALGGGLSDLDIAVACAGDDQVRFYANTGTGGFSEASGSPLNVGDAPSDVEAALMNADARIDLIVTNRGSDTVQVFTNAGVLVESAVSFELRGTVSAGDEPVDSEPVDLDNDKDLDIVTGNFGSGTVSHAMNDSTGDPSPSTFASAGPGPSGIAAGDLDGDQLADVVSANQLGDSVSVLRNVGSPTFALANVGNVPGGDAPRSAAIVDIDGDGDLDVAVVTTDAETTQRVVRVFQNNTTTGDPITLTAAADLGGGAQPVYVLDGDVNDDGREDLIVVEQGGGAALAASSGVTVFLNTTVPSCAGDANGDGLVNGADLSVLLSNFGNGVPTGLDGDLNSDHLVNGADLSVLLSNFGSTC